MLTDGPAGDAVELMVTNNTGLDVSMISLTASSDDGTGFFKLMDKEETIDGESGQVEAKLLHSYRHKFRRFATRYRSVKFTFDDDQSGFENLLADLWINHLRVDPEGTRYGGIGNLLGLGGADIEATVMFTDGTTLSGTFLADAKIDGKANLSLTPVPLPAPAFLLLAGVAGLGAMRRFKKV